MRVLIVEDDDEKASRVSFFIQANYVVDDLRIARSFHSGLREIIEGGADFVVLDMTMRNYDKSLDEDGGRPHPFAGREILRQMKRERISTPVVIFTQFDHFGDKENRMTLDELTKELERRFQNYLGTVYYHSGIDDWQEELGQIFDGLLAGRDK